VYELTTDAPAFKTIRSKALDIIEEKLSVSKNIKQKQKEAVEIYKDSSEHMVTAKLNIKKPFKRNTLGVGKKPIVGAETENVQQKIIQLQEVPTKCVFCYSADALFVNESHLKRHYLSCLLLSNCPNCEKVKTFLPKFT
jgi:hypothetical protein